MSCYVPPLTVQQWQRHRQHGEKMLSQRAPKQKHCLQTSQNHTSLGSEFLVRSWSTFLRRGFSRTLRTLAPVSWSCSFGQCTSESLSTLLAHVWRYPEQHKVTRHSLWITRAYLLHLRKFNYPDDVILIKWSSYLSLKHEYIFKTLDDSKPEETVQGKENYQRK